VLQTLHSSSLFGVSDSDGNHQLLQHLMALAHRLCRSGSGCRQWRSAQQLPIAEVTRTMTILAVVVALLAAAGPAAAQTPPGATIVYGQSDFSHATAGTSATALSGPNDVKADTSGNVYVADYGNSRVLFFPAFSSTATRVYGQGGSFTSNTINNGGVTANSFSHPWSVAVGPNGVYVSDTFNNRVLYALVAALASFCILILSFVRLRCTLLSVTSHSQARLRRAFTVRAARSPRARPTTAVRLRVRLRTRAPPPTI
jgi:hypothetical protein